MMNGLREYGTDVQEAARALAYALGFRDCDYCALALVKFGESHKTPDGRHIEEV